MAGNLDSSVKDSLMNFVVSELVRPSTNQVYDCIKSEIGSGRHHVLAALLASIVTECQNVPNYAREVSLRSVGVYESLLNSNDSDYNMMFRMKRSTIKDLVTIMSKQQSSVPVEKKVLLTCWLMGNMESYAAASLVFGLSTAQVYKIFCETCTKLAALAGTYVQWPTSNECARIMEDFEDQYGFPGVIGVIGSCCIKIKNPKHKGEGRKLVDDKSNLQTVILQAVCDNKMIFTDVYAVYPGPSSPSLVLAGSPLYRRLINTSDPLIEPCKRILGSADYPQLATLLTPYHSNAGEQEHRFNLLHKTASNILDSSFRLLKERFCRLYCVDVSHAEVVSQVILAACVLHNFALLHGDEFNLS